jgi:PEP-CTERM motif-containing protein/fibronectin-binding protein
MSKAKMNKYLMAGAFIAAFGASAAYASDVTITGYSLPDPDAYGAGVVNGYSWYDGPVELQVSGGPDIIAYCADLNHDLHGQTYHYGLLKENGLGGGIDEATSFRIGTIAAMGFADLAAGGDANDQLAAAAQLAIWSIEYGTTPTSFDTADYANIQTDYNAFIALTPTGTERYAEVLIPNGNWPGDSSLSQQMVVGLSAVPEPSTWAMLVLGFAGLGYAGFHRQRKTSVAAFG